ncbi:MAG: hypothetical protein IID33_02350 [Planctomycetes bacterium]|nr:hypothetical protein [Planctomycetota bacterium]
MANHQDRAFDDLRNTLGEYTRILRSRWRVALLGLGVVSSIAFWYSQYLPRQYRASTIFERRDDTVLQNLIRSTASPYSFGQLKSSISLDMTGSRALARAAVEIGILPTDAIMSEGALSNDELRRLDVTLAQYDLSASVSLLQNSTSLDVIELRCDANDPRMAHRFAVVLRDRYMEETSERISVILSRTKDFFASQVTGYRDKAQQTDLRLKNKFAEFPGVDPTDPASAGTRLEALQIEQSRLAQRTDEIQARIKAREDFLRSPPSPRWLEHQTDQTVAPAVVAAPPQTDPRIRSQMKATLNKITSLMNNRRMTSEHPSVKALYRTMDQLYDQQQALTVAVPGQPAERLPQETSEAFREWKAERPRVELELNVHRGELAVVTGRLHELDARVAKFSKLYDQIVKEGGMLRAMQAQLDEESANASVWRQYQAQLSRIMAAEKEQRGTQFTLIEEPKDIARALKPRSAPIFAMCFGLGFAAAALMVALAELLDRSFRSVGQVTRVLGVPVLECVGLIPTPQVRRRRRIAQLIWAPTISILVLMLVTTATLAYASLEMPSLHDRAIARIDRALSAVGAPTTRLSGDR